MSSDLEWTRRVRATLGWLFEPGSRRLARMLADHGPDDTAAILRDGVLPHDELRHELRQASGSRLPLDQMWRTASEVVAAQQERWQILIPEDTLWPEGLREQGGVDNRWDPVCLWTNGPAALTPTSRSVAVVGARHCTAYGRQLATDFGWALAEAGYTVVTSSGFGIDEAVLSSALANPHTVPPVVVQPCGLDLMHPNANRRLLEQVADHALLISAWPPSAQPSRTRIQANQRLIAAITRGTVVVEAGTHSAAVHTVAHAAQLGRVAMAVPGPVTSAQSAGCHQLLRTDPRVRLVTTAGDVMEQLPPLPRKDNAA